AQTVPEQTARARRAGQLAAADGATNREPGQHAQPERERQQEGEQRHTSLRDLVLPLDGGRDRRGDGLGSILEFVIGERGWRLTGTLAQTVGKLAAAGCQLLHTVREVGGAAGERTAIRGELLRARGDLLHALL